MVASRWLGAGKAKAQGRGRVWGHRLPSPPCSKFSLEFTYVFRLSVSIREVADEYPFCVLIYTNPYIIKLYISHLFHLIYFLVKHMFNISHPGRWTVFLSPPF